jgi:hypothetical protein
MLLQALLLTTFAAAEPPPVAIYDLTYALRFKPADAAQVADAWDHVHLASTLQGNANRTAPRLYLRYVDAFGVQVDDFWGKRLSEPGGWMAGRKTRTIKDIGELVDTFRDSIKGAVVYDPAVAATSNLASTIAGVEDLVAIRYDLRPESLYSKLILSGPRLPVKARLLNEDGSPMFTGRGTIPGTKLTSTGSAKCDAYLWLKANYIDTGKVDATFAGFYLDWYWHRKPTAANPNQHTVTNHDFFVAKRGFFFDLSCWADEPPVDDPRQSLGTDLKTLKTLLLAAYEHGGRERMTHIGGFTPWPYKYTDFGKAGKHGGVATEWEFARIASAYNAYVDADANGNAAMANASFFMHFPLKERYPQRWVTREELRERGYLDADGKVRFDGRDFFVFYVGDFDSAAWIYQFMPSLWESPARGKLPLMWCITPVAERRAGPLLDYFRRTATPNDYFAAADNGAGYLNPGMLQTPRAESNLPSGLDAWARHCEPLYRRWDLTISGFVIDGSGPGLNKEGLDCYARFSPNGIVPQNIPVSLLHGNMPVLRADYDLADDPNRAAETLLARVAMRQLPFHWFRAIVKSPDWYAKVYEQARAKNPKLELLDGPTFFELYRIYLQTTPDAAAGKIPLAKSEKR